MHRISLFLALLLVPGEALVAQTTPLWSYVAPGDIEFFRVTPLGTLVVATRFSLSGVDGTTGSRLWSWADIGVLEETDLFMIPNTPFAVLGSRDGFEVMDVGTGTSKWNFASLSVASLTGQVPIVEQRILLVYGRRADKGSTLLAVDLESGAVRWRQDNVFPDPPERVGPPGPRKSTKSMLGHQPPIVDTDTSMVLYVSKGGPIKIDLRTGAVLWRSNAFSKSDPPAPIAGYARMLLADDVLYVPTEKRLTAIDVRDGHVLWDRTDLKSKPSQVDWTPQGLVVRVPHIDLLDRRTGASLWGKPFTDLKNSTPYVVRGDTVYVAADGVFYGISVVDGTAAELSRYDLRGEKQPDALDALETGFLVRTAQNLVVFDTTGAKKHHLFYPPPKMGTLARVALSRPPWR